jgi:serine/threonine-protein kinase SRPK3
MSSENKTFVPNQKKLEQLQRLSKNRMGIPIPRQARFKRRQHIEIEDFSSDDDSDTDEKYFQYGGYHIVKLDDIYNEKYLVKTKLGHGHSSTVWLVEDITKDEDEPHKYCTLKVFKSEKSYTEAADDEIKLLRNINGYNKVGNKYIIQILDRFTIEGPNGDHRCLILELMWKDSFHLLKNIYHQEGLPIPMLKTITYQMLEALSVIHEQAEVIHTDIKPENILVNLPYDITDDKLGIRDIPEPEEIEKYREIVKELEKKKEERKKMKKKLASGQRKKLRNTQELLTKAVKKYEEDRYSLPDPDFSSVDKPFYVKLSDFGNAVPEEDQVSDDITTEEYRSPEVILENGYFCATDVFSMGVTFYELATGSIILSVDEDSDVDKDEQQLGMMVDLLGDFPRKVLKESKVAKNYFTKNGEFRNYESTLDIMEKQLYHDGFPKEHIDMFADLLRKMMNLNQHSRITAKLALNHPWFKGEYYDFYDDEINKDEYYVPIDYRYPTNVEEEVEKRKALNEARKKERDDED